MSLKAISLELIDIRKVLSRWDCLEGTTFIQNERPEGRISVTNGQLLLQDKDTIIRIQDNDFENENSRLRFLDHHRELGKLLSFVITQTNSQQQNKLTQEDLKGMTEVFVSKKISLSFFGILNFLNKLVKLVAVRNDLKDYIENHLVPAAIENLSAEVANKIDCTGYLGEKNNPNDPAYIINSDALITLRKIKHGMNSTEISNLINKINNPSTIDAYSLYLDLVEKICNHHKDTRMFGLNDLDLQHMSEVLFNDGFFLKGTTAYNLCKKVAHGEIRL